MPRNLEDVGTSTRALSFGNTSILWDIRWHRYWHAIVWVTGRLHWLAGAILLLWYIWNYLVSYNVNYTIGEAKLSQSCF